MSYREPLAVRADTDRWPHRRFRPIVPGRRIVPTGFLGMLILVALVETAVSLAGSRFLDIVPFGWTFSAGAASKKTVGADILFLGDSLVKHGLSPRVFREVTGRSAYNLAAPASTAPMTYTLYRRAVDAGAHPSVIVFDLKPSLQVGGLEYNVRNFSQVMSFRELFGVCRAVRFRGAVTELMVNSVLGSYRCRHEIRGAIFAALAGKNSPYLNYNILSERNFQVNDGVNIATPKPTYNGTVTEPEHAHLISKGFFANRLNVDYTHRLLTLAGEQRTRTYLVLPPFVADLTERRRQTGAELKYEAYVRSLQDRFPRLTVLDARASGYPYSVFIDPIHLDLRGTLALSDDVAQILREDLKQVDPMRAPKRWIKLPAYRPRPIPPDLEDVELSRARIGLSQGE